MGPGIERRGLCRKCAILVLEPDLSSGLRVGLVGAGMVSAYHVAGWQAAEGAALVAIADPDPARAAGRAARVPGAQVFSTLDEMIAAVDLDVIDIATPPATHAGLVGRAQAAGLHVICQKPLAGDAARAAAIVDALSSSSRVMVHENWRWRATYRALRTALKESRIAAPGRFEFRVESAGLLKDASGLYPALQRQPFFATMPRLLVFELLVHHLDVLAFLFGDVEILAAELSRRCPAVIGEDRARIELMAGGMPGVLTADFCVEGQPAAPKDLLFIDAGGKPVVDGWELNLPGANARRWNPEDAYQASYTSTISHFIDCLAAGTPFETPPQEALKTLRLVDRIYEIAGWP